LFITWWAEPTRTGRSPP